MFRIADGRDEFYQWDLDRQVIVEDSSVTEVHFCNRTDDCSLVVEVVDGLANVPNILLQSSFDIRVFGYDGKATLHDKKFKVNARTQPADYVYTETVVKSIEEIMNAAEQVNTITTEFYEFVDEYKVGLTDDGQGNVELKAVEKPGGDTGGDVDLSDYYTKEETDLLIADATEDLASEVKSAKEIYNYELGNLYYKENDLLPITDELIEFAQRTFAGEKVYLNIKHCAINNIASTFIEFLNEINVQVGRTISVDPFSVETFEDVHKLSQAHLLHFTIKNDPDQGWTAKVVKDNSDLLASKDYVDEAIAAISSADLDNYFTKDETTQAIQDALSAIGVAEGGAY
jgi:hypothetical protein